ncbi:hypothetical protein ACP4OV_008849 [Aristida adscensionis]
MASGGRGSGRGSRGKKKVDESEEVLSEGSFGPEIFDNPDPDLPLCYKREFRDGIPDRTYNYSYHKEKWPIYRCDLPCAMQVYDGPNINAGRRFFRCPKELDMMRVPSLNGLILLPVDYIMHLHNKIMNLQHHINSMPTPPSSSENVISIYEDFFSVCFDQDTCPCACHNKTRRAAPPPPPPSPHVRLPEWHLGSAGFYH